MQPAMRCMSSKARTFRTPPNNRRFAPHAAENLAAVLWDASQKSSDRSERLSGGGSGQWKFPQHYTPD
ncbi:hypothetical protein CA54_29940 [Symmachiella macrocystis]|uniref:Uncharacterized protein n=1 Tax=Symmachiella macrocystis TaxID=2527985 RepID=A0A5C6BRV7_9PLAN|nr:hypothetical protein CA54_29940 [Symmachiella macrocystis]